MHPFYLYVWRHVLYDYTDGLAVAYATSLAEAKALLIARGIPEERWHHFRLDGQSAEVFNVATAVHVYG